MKKLTYLLFACTAMIAFALSSCSSDGTIDEIAPVTDPDPSTTSQVTVLQVDGLSATKLAGFFTGVSSFNCDSLNAVMSTTDTLTVEEVAYLLQLRTERKFQQDLMIAAQEHSEQSFMYRMYAAHKTHQDAMARMLQFYGIEAPDLGAVGVFEDTALQEKYNAVVAAMTGDVETLQVLMAVMEQSIVTLRDELAVATNENIKIVLENMLRATQNHLCVLNIRLQEFDVTYVPTILTAEEFAAIIENGIQRGSMYADRSRFGLTNGEKGGHMNRMTAQYAKHYGYGNGGR